ncbi:MAG: hypoxanthine phosphoribosyltransferase [Clostridia bacterium]|nr:hypoxanthine phosphoribosyltransferase [Clostridia bacterium]
MGTQEKIQILIKEAEVEKRISELADQINNDFKGEKVLLIGVLKGSFMFLSDLAKKITLDTEVYFIEALSYGDGTSTSGVVKITKDIDRDIKDENVIIVEDIIDTGITMSKVMEIIKFRGAKTVRLASCLSKPSRRRVEIDIDYLGFEVEDKFIVGYGLDCAQKYRNLPYIGVIEE